MTESVDIKDSFLAGMRRLASGVCVVSTQHNDQRFAMTVSSLTSVSDSPPSLLVCLNKDAAMQPFMTKGQAFAVNLLSRQQEDISNNCAFGSPEERLAIGEWLDSSEGIPYLKGCQVTFFCTVDKDDYDYGTHQIVIGQIELVHIAGDNVDPLVYLDGQYVDVTFKQ